MHPRGDAQRLEELRSVVARLRADGHIVWPHLTFEPGDAVRLARLAARAGASTRASRATGLAPSTMREPDG